MNEPANESVAEPRRLAAIDVGTNSVRLIVAEARGPGSYRLLDDEKETTRLGRGLAIGGVLSRQAMETSADAIARMKQIATGYGAEQVRIVGTAAVREALNAKEFLAMVQERAGIDLEVLSAEDEARLAFVSVSHAFDLRGMSAAIVDIGGGSTEVILSSGGVVESIHSMPVGAVTLTERFGLDGPVGDRDFKEVRRRLRRMIREHLRHPAFAPQVVFGTGGTFTTLAAIALNRRSDGPRGDAPAHLRGLELHRSDVQHHLETLRSLPARGRQGVKGMGEDRADIIVGGVMLAERVMKHLGVNLLRIHDRGIRDGMILGMIAEQFPSDSAAPMPPDRMQAARRFAAACNYEKAHSEHVAMLAMQAFDQLMANPPAAMAKVIRPEHRDLMEAAAVLHDVGYLINYSRHHKHSYHLIVHSAIAGFTQRELAIIANVARYHRRAAPRKRHDNFHVLEKEDRQVVRVLASILRIVDGLDRGHSQAVTSLAVMVRRGTAWFLATADQEPAVDIWGGVRKSELFSKVFGLEARLEWAGPRFDVSTASGIEATSDAG